MNTIKKIGPRTKPCGTLFHELCGIQSKALLRSIKLVFNCKMHMPGTVKCRPTVAYWVQIDGINIATELITRYYLNETLIQCCFNARPTSATLAQHWINVGLQCLGESPPAAQQTQDICITFIQRRPNVFDVGPTLHEVIQMFCVYWVSIQAFGVKQFPNPRSNTVSLFASQGPTLKYIWTCCDLRTCS